MLSESKYAKDEREKEVCHTAGDIEVAGKAALGWAALLATPLPLSLPSPLCPLCLLTP